MFVRTWIACALVAMSAQIGRATTPGPPACSYNSMWHMRDVGNGVLWPEMFWPPENNCSNWGIGLNFCDQIPAGHTLEYSVSDFDSLSMLSTEEFLVEIGGNRQPVEVHFSTVWPPDGVTVEDFIIGVEVTTRNWAATGIQVAQMTNSTIYINFADYAWGVGTLTGQRLTNTVRHEVGHSMGFADAAETHQGLMNCCYNMGVMNTDELTQKSCVLDAYMVTWCEEGFPGGGTIRAANLVKRGDEAAVIAVFGELSVGEEIIIQTRRGDTSGGYVYHELIESRMEEHWVTALVPSMLQQEDLLVTIENKGSVLASLPVVNGSVGESSTILQYDDIKSDNCEGIVSERWRAVAMGELTPPRITDTVRTACDYLYVVYEDFTDEIAPLCDMWEQRGVSVEMVVVDESMVDRDLIANCIANYYTVGGIDGVCLVGGSHRRYEEIDFPPFSRVNMIPTYYYDDLYSKGTTDSNYGDVDEDGELDVFIGRIPALEPFDVAWYVYKVLRMIGNLDSTDSLPADYGRVQLAGWPTHNARRAGEPLGMFHNNRVVREDATAMFGEMQSYIADPGINTAYFDSYQHCYDAWLSGNGTLYDNCVEDALRDVAESSSYIYEVMPIEGSGSILMEVFTGMDGGLSDHLPSYSFVYNCNAGDHEPNITVLPGWGTTFADHWARREIVRNNSVIVFAPAGTSGQVANRSVGEYINAHILDGFPNVQNPASIGQIWKNLFNDCENRHTNPYECEWVHRYIILGDPMLPVFNVNTGLIPVDVASEDDFRIGLRIKDRLHESGVQMEIRGAGRGRLDVYDIRGRQIATVYDGEIGGSQHVVWRGVDSGGARVCSGVYLARLRCDHAEFAKKFVYIK